MTPRKARAQRFGRWGEGLAAFALRLSGWRILARGFRGGGGEIDLIAERGSVLAVIEVKARQDEATALHALGPAQRQRIVNATRAFIAARPGLMGRTLRFDVMIIRPWRWPRRLAGAFREDGL